MPRTRVLAIDDSALARKILKDGLSAAADVDLLGVCGTLGIALSRGSETPPQVVVLDLFMADEDWSSSLARVRSAWPRARVLALVPDSPEGLAIGQQARAAGALDLIARPLTDAEFNSDPAAFCERLLGKVRAMSLTATNVLARTNILPRSALPAPRRAARAVPRIDVLAIGVSTGGPNALAEVLPALPESFPIPIVIVQHMPPVFTANLAQNLDALSRIDVREAADGVELRPGVALIAPGDRHMTVERKPGGAVQIVTNQDAPENFCRPAVDVLFRSVASCFGSGTLAVVLTGMGQDGLLGAQVIAAAGGTVLAQDEGSSVVWGMPGAIARQGLADDILPLNRVAPDIVRRVTGTRGDLAREA